MAFTERLEIRHSREEGESWAKATATTGFRGVSTWMRTLANAAARRTLRPPTVEVEGELIELKGHAGVHTDR